MHTLFISDLHLSDVRPGQLVAFRNLLGGPARYASHIYILGDLFEAWAGDDDDSPGHEEIQTIIRDCVNSGTKISVMRGNRDYLLGKRFAEKTGVELLPDIVTVNLYGKDVLLMHGDLLCTRDWQYQWMRRIINNRPAICLFLCLPLSIRKRIWHGVRNLTQQSVADKLPEIMDVDEESIRKLIQKYPVDWLIHGHTHRPNDHEINFANRTVHRYVLGDWYQQDSVLVVDDKSCQRMTVANYADYVSAQSA